MKQSDSRSRRKKGAKTQPQGLREKTMQLPGRSEKITCDKCGRRRFGLPYEVKRKFFTGGGAKK